MSFELLFFECRNKSELFVIFKLGNRIIFYFSSPGESTLWYAFVYDIYRLEIDYLIC